MKTTNPKDCITLLNVFLIGVKEGVIDKNEVTKWADEIILSEQEPDYFIIELALAKDKNQLISLLKEYIGENTSIVASRVVFSLLYSLYQTSVFDISKVIKILYRINIDEDLSDFENQRIYWLESEYELALDGYSNMNLVLINVEKFFVEYQALNMENINDWVLKNNEIEINLINRVNSIIDEVDKPWYKFW